MKTNTARHFTFTTLVPTTATTLSMDSFLLFVRWLKEGKVFLFSYDSFLDFGNWGARCSGTDISQVVTCAAIRTSGKLLVRQESKSQLWEKKSPARLTEVSGDMSNSKLI